VTRRAGGLIEIDFDLPDEWLEEDEELVGHARDPFHRIDARRTSRHIRVSIGGEVVADTAQLERNTEHRTTCAYKGHATHWDAAGEKAIAWCYDEPLNDAVPVKGLIAFYNERTDIEVDGELEERPQTQWSVS
jgi:uncharacterized protein (DUF427 family)